MLVTHLGDDVQDTGRNKDKAVDPGARSQKRDASAQPSLLIRKASVW